MRLRRSDEIDPQFPGLSDAQFGSIVEERLGTALLAQAPGLASVAFPLVDLGFDFYVRRIRTLRVHPVQVKARSFLEADGLFEVSVSSLHADPGGYVVMPYVPPPDWQLAPNLFLVPIPDFLEIAHRHADGYLLFSGHLDPDADEPASRYIVQSNRLEGQWLRRIPGWTSPINAPQLETREEDVPRRSARSFGKAGELWLASQLIGQALDRVSIAQDRLRLDCVDLLLHDLNSFSRIGLAIHSSSIVAHGNVEFRNRYRTFFVDDQLYVVLLVYRQDSSLHDVAFVIPAADLPRLGTTSNDRGDPGLVVRFKLEPLAEKMRPYAVPSGELATSILRRLGN